MSKRALVIDGNSLVYRMYFASEMQIPYYKSKGLPPANAIKLMLLVMMKIISNTNYDYALVAFDGPKEKLIRTAEFAEYKSGRNHMPDDLRNQLDDVQHSVELLGMKWEIKIGTEADDLIGSFSTLMNANDINVDIYTSDKDMLQLVNPLTTVNLLKTGISDILAVTKDNFAEVFFGLAPHQVTDFKGISGDSSDNLCGVSGIGPKTASKLILEYGSLEKIYENLDKLSEGQRNKFIASKEHAIVCKRLSTISMNEYKDFSVQHFEKKPIKIEELKEFIKKYNLNGFDKYFN